MSNDAPVVLDHFLDDAVEVDGQYGCGRVCRAAAETGAYGDAFGDGQ